ncbi:hypothetical protein BJ322DRAFT_1211533 [Thelephora terrestris]|uniref:Uncharacterized protein n=1 Tax=Thelephora terrestris TaxID=56493 RepID=A0A9P6L6C6_9AGAM|nr:hypothetical protein BJ322DRAFT_1211533 [Thelephora terrestris]
MCSGRNGLQDMTQADNDLRIPDELQVWSNFVCSPAGRERQGSEKEYSDKLRLAERTLLEVAVTVRLRHAMNRTCSVKNSLQKFSHVASSPSSLTPLSPRPLETLTTAASPSPTFANTGERSRMLDMHLRLSGSRLLDIRLHGVGPRFLQSLPEPYELDLKMTGLPANISPRVRTLVIHQAWICRQCQFPEGSLPELETLSITSNNGLWDGSYPSSGERLEDLFKGGLPRHRRLFVAELTPWPNDDFKNLTLICLYNQSSLEEELPELLHMLRGSRAWRNCSCANMIEAVIRKTLPRTPAQRSLVLASLIAAI